MGHFGLGLRQLQNWFYCNVGHKQVKNQNCRMPFFVNDNVSSLINSIHTCFSSLSCVSF